MPCVNGDPAGVVERVPTYKEALENVRQGDLPTNYGFLGYPIRQCADECHLQRTGSAAFRAGWVRIRSLRMWRFLARLPDDSTLFMGCGSDLGTGQRKT